jgi:N-methylhydantoinase A/oxoprolinase/acetone carboxylase beta subunit
MSSIFERSRTFVPSDALDIRLGVDVGGTNTDAVLLDKGGKLLAKIKTPTTTDVTTGIETAIVELLKLSGVSIARITHVMLGTTHATNAVLERRGLERVAVLRIGGPATHAIPPLFGWPEDLRRAVSAGEIIVNGGFEFNGDELADFDADGVRRFLGSLPGDVHRIAVTSVFAPISAAHELGAAEIIRAERGEDFHISLSHEIGSLGLLERENATILNEALVGVALAVINAIKEGLRTTGLGHAVVFFAQNDGTLMSLEGAVHLPVLTIGSGPANSIRGAAFLSGVRDAIVADVGGTSTDIGVLINGFPRESSAGVIIGGISTNFRMPDLVSIALGGGTVVRETDGEVVLGPDSVGYRLAQCALIFGGDATTMSDAAVATGRAQFGTAGVSTNDLFARAMAAADAMVAEGIDRVKLSKGDVPLIAVGGGSVLLSDLIPGVSEVLRPRDFDVANAVGAAIGTVGGQIDRIYQSASRTRESILDEAMADAVEQAVLAGAEASLVEVVDLDEMPIAYMTNPAVRVRVKAAGPLAGL